MPTLNGCTIFRLRFTDVAKLVRESTASFSLLAPPAVDIEFESWHANRKMRPTSWDLTVVWGAP